MFKRFMRWILLLIVLVVIAAYFVLSPMVVSRAAGPGSSPMHIVAPNYFIPDYVWRH